MKLSQCWLIAMVLLASSPSWAAPGVTLTPITDHPKAADKISGSGFRASELVRVYWDTTNILLAVTDGSGNFGPLKFKVPGDALPGEHWVTAAGKKAGDAAQAPFTVSTAWVEHGFNPKGTRSNPYENVISPSNAGSLDLAWSAATGGEIHSSPVVANGTVYVGSDDHQLYAFDAATGALKWTGLAADKIRSTPAVANGVVYVGADDWQLWTFDANTGAKGWFTGTGGPIESSPAVANGNVYVGSEDGNLYAFNAQSGAPVWTANTGDTIVSSPAVANGAVYVGDFNLNLYAFDAATGSLLWNKTNFCCSISASPAVANGRIYMGNDGDEFLTWDIAGNYLWGEGNLVGPNDTSAAVAGQIVYAGTGEGGSGAHLYALNAATGAAFWVDNAPAPIESSPAAANGVVYYGSDDHTINAVAAGPYGGQLLWQGVTGGNVTSSPTVADGMIYVGSNDGKLYAFALDGGNNAVYRHRHTRPPSYATLHPNLHLKLAR